MSFTLRRLLRSYSCNPSPRSRNSAFVTMLDCIVRITAKSLVFVLFVPAYTKITFLIEGFKVTKQPVNHGSLKLEPHSWPILVVIGWSQSPSDPRQIISSAFYYLWFNDLSSFKLKSCWLTCLQPCSILHALVRKSSMIWSASILCVICITCHLFFCAFLY